MNKKTKDFVMTHQMKIKFHLKMQA
ncbi:rCG59321, partial [Rattus norvegicus]